ncbi:MAG: hypothetical protein H0T51_18590 [Pirellulales bacterium]|nr:hypothetical protein [Pirellulales bacterium]
MVNTLDERIIHEVRTGTGKIMAWADDPFNSEPNEGVEWRSLLALRADPVSGAAPYVRSVDWDVEDNGPGAAAGDGMPSWWEAKHGLDPLALDHNGDFDADGYTNLEGYVNELAEWPAPAPIVFNGAANNRFAQIANWDVNADPLASGLWQPSKYDEARVNGGTAVVDAAGQHAGTLVIAANNGDTARVNITEGWLEVQDAVVIGGTPTAQGTLNLSGGMLRAPLLAKGVQGEFDFTGGVLSADVVGFDLVNQGGVIAPGGIAGETHILGDLAMPSGVIALEIGGTAAGTFDRIVVDGQLAAGGELEVSLLGGFSPAAGDAFDLLDFSSMTGAFTLDLPALAAGLQWDATHLASSGVLAVAVAPLAPADFNHDGSVDQLDLAAWTAGFGSSGQIDNTHGDADLDGDIDGGDFLAWQRQLGGVHSAATAVPEPATAWLAITVAFAAPGVRCTSIAKRR